MYEAVNHSQFLLARVRKVPVTNIGCISIVPAVMNKNFIVLLSISKRMSGQYRDRFPVISFVTK
jgi:hypothetical protein